MNFRHLLSCNTIGNIEEFALESPNQGGFASVS